MPAVSILLSRFASGSADQKKNPFSMYGCQFTYVPSVCMNVLAGTEFHRSNRERLVVLLRHLCENVVYHSVRMLEFQCCSYRLTLGIFPPVSLDDFCHVHATYFTDLCEFGSIFFLHRCQHSLPFAFFFCSILNFLPRAAAAFDQQFLFDE